jgi:type VI secretion system secreted protein VgrG
MEVVAGMQLLKATDITIVGDSLVTLVMGASVICVTKASVSFAGVSLKIDGEVIDEAALVADN